MSLESLVPFLGLAFCFLKETASELRDGRKPYNSFIKYMERLVKAHMALWREKRLLFCTE